MADYKFKVSNMNCEGCVSNIQRALEGDENIASFNIELSDKHVTVQSELDEQAVAQVIRDAGYDAVPDTGKRGLFHTIFSK